MLKGLVGFIADSNEKAVGKLRPKVLEINDLEPRYEKLSDEDLKGEALEFKGRLERGETLEELLPEAFAAVREAAKRTIGQRHFDVQLMGGIVLHQGKIAEMKTGEGKTLVATLPLYLNALEGKGAHLVTVNDYLAKRDTQWMGPIYHLLGLSVGCLQHEASFIYDPSAEGDVPSLRHLRPVSRRDAYLADITYGTNNEYGFDYLRDNMVSDLSQVVQREQRYAIVDEVDNILIDEARTPLIISGPARESEKLYQTFAKLVPRLQGEVDYQVDEKQRVVTLTELGVNKIEKWLNISNIYDPSNYGLVQYVENALRAQVIFQRDRDYVIREGEAVIVDEFTGRLMLGRRYSDGLHQAIEAKESLRVQRENITLATITLQNYFRLYHKLAGMTGTAATEAEEFWKIYKLDVVTMPTHKAMVRKDSPDYVFKTEDAKFEAVAKEIGELHKKGRPVLVGTVSIEKSERLSELLKRKGIPHQVLNAKQHEKEAAIIAQAGGTGTVTVSTNMAGRGTDIILGGNPASAGMSQEEWEGEHNKVVELEGLHIIGTERHEARRIDNQLRGRAGRQGDPGSSRFYISLEDDLMRRFGGDRIKAIMNWAGIEDDVPLENRMVTRAVESAQSKVEAYNFEIRKHLVDYDDVVNKHRDVIYGERRKILSGADLKGNVQDMIRREIQSLVDIHLADKNEEKWNLSGLATELRTIFPLPSDLQEERLSRLSREEIQENLLKYAEHLYQERETGIGAEIMRYIERRVMLGVIDAHWVEHLTSMEGLRQGIGLEAYGQRDPLVVYKTKGHELFQGLLDRIQHDIVGTIYHVTLPQQRAVVAQNESTTMLAQASQRADAVAAGSRKIGRNDPCPCGSGKKFKRCHGA